MSSERANEDGRLGRCPCCATIITTSQILIEYETADGRKVYSECPHCFEVVHPETL